MTESCRRVDIAIIGAGPVGMALARALEGSGLNVVLIDRRPRGSWAEDPRALAIAHGSRQLLGQLDAWAASDATAIREIHVSQQGGFGQTRLHADDYRLPALGYVMRYRDLAGRLDLGLADTIFLCPASVDRIEADPETVRLHLTHRGTPTQLDARLVVHAEGTPSDTSEFWTHDYRQQAIIAEVRPAADHQLRAWERFTPEGPLALLPLERSLAVVLTAPAEQATQLLALDDAGFLDTLRQRVGQGIDFVSTGPRAAFPLGLRLRKTLVRDRQVWIGNTAQTLHPVTGQGFNLGLRDAWELADTLWDHARQDPGAPATLRHYAGKRQRDRLAVTAMTDGFVRLFSNDIPPLRALRGLGLLALDLAPPLRHLIARQMIWGARSGG